eukprot:1724469-Amphidinium_carterae.1
MACETSKLQCIDTCELPCNSPHMMLNCSVIAPLSPLKKGWPLRDLSSPGIHWFCICSSSCKRCRFGHRAKLCRRKLDI